MSILLAVFFGLVQGFTEFFPLSSSGHLAVLGGLFGVENGNYNFPMFCVFVHLGTVISAIIMYWNDIADMIYEIAVMRSDDKSLPRYKAVKLLYLIIIATLPLIAGAFIYSKVSLLSSVTWFVGVCVILNGLLLVVAGMIPNRVKGAGQMTAIDAVITGCGQLISMIPGLSRVGVTMGTAMATGIRPEFSYKFAVMLSIPASFGGIILSAVRASSYGFEWSMLPSFLVGMAVSILAGVAAIRIMQEIVKSGKFRGFAYYCWVAGVLFIILTLIF